MGCMACACRAAIQHFANVVDHINGLSNDVNVVVERTSYYVDQIFQTCTAR